MARKERKSHLIAILLALFAGGLGVDRFYLGHTKLGVAKLVLTLSLFGAIISVPWAVVDLILIATGKEKYNLE